MSIMSHRRGPCPDLDDETDLSESARHEMVAEAVAIFGEDAARELAGRLRVSFDVAVPEAV